MKFEKDRQDPAFYVDGPGQTVVWDGDESGRFYVARCGEMRILYSPNLDSQEVIRYTDDLEAIGVTNDALLEKFTELGEEMFCWIHNAWFEVIDSSDEQDLGEVYHALDEAVERAIHLAERKDSE